MHTFRVWAPARTVALQLDNSVTPMQQEPRGWWIVTCVQAAHGSDYAFLIDDDSKAYPDPRSLWQPNGVHQASRVYDHARFNWTDAGWHPPELKRSVIYELHIGTFTPEGTFDSAIRKLEYLVSLGITHLEVMPVASFPGSRGWGYDGVSIYSTYEGYGGPDGLKRFVNACHNIGLAVLLDVVYNHFGPTGNYTGKFGPYLTDSHSTPWGGAVNLEEAGSYDVRRFYCDNAISWLRDFHLDGLRLDAIHALVDRSAIHFLEQLSQEVAELSATLNRHLMLIAESDLNDPRIVIARQEHGLGMDAQWSDDFHHSLFVALTNEKQGYYEDFGLLSHLCKAFTSTFVYDGVYSPYRDCIHGRPTAGLSQSRFLGYIQNHDQIGNRALGDRLYPLISEQRAFIAAALVLMAPFVPMLFQGEEFGSSSPFQYFADHEDPVMADAVSKGRRRDFAAFGWPPEEIPDPESVKTFLNSKLKWEEVDGEPHSRFVKWHRDLIALRMSEPFIYDPDLHKTECRSSEEEGWIVLGRGPIAVFCNLGTRQQSFHTTNSPALLLSSPETVIYSNHILSLAPDAVAILKAEDSSQLSWTVEG